MQSQKRALVHQNKDPNMKPTVRVNKGDANIVLSSKLKEYHPNLIETLETITLKPGVRTIVPHMYYEGIYLGQGQAKCDVFYGEHAPELRNYKAYYEEILLVPDNRDFGFRVEN